MSKGIRIGPGLLMDLHGLTRLQAAMRRLQSMDLSDLLDTVGSVVESQTRTRISKEKTDPKGKAWAPWSPEYAATRHSGHSLLVNEGNLRDSIEYQVEGDAVIVGSNLVYANYQNEMRTFLGLSDENEDELQRVISDWLHDQMGTF